MADPQNMERGNWGSKIAFIFAASGSAIGLGSMWRFPLMVGRKGGALFVLGYIIAVIFIGFTVMLAELTIGRHTQKNPVGAFEAIKPGSPWKLIGYMGVISGVCILSYYSVIAGWAAGYFYKALTGAFHKIGPLEGEALWQASDGIFKSFAANPAGILICLAGIIALTAFVISKGVKGGIEKWSKILMPVLFGIIVILSIRALSLPGAKAGLSFYLKPDFSQFNTDVIFFTIGQAFFSLSLGMGTMMTYGSYLPKRDNLVSSAGWVCFSTTLIAILAGLIIFPTLFDTLHLTPELFKQEFEVSTGLMFQVLPIIIAQMPGGYIFGILFFSLLLIAALTSTISMLEVPTAYLVDERRWSRKKAVIWIGFFAFLIGTPSALSSGGVPWLTKFGFMAKMDLLWGNILLAVGGLFICLFLVHAWKIPNALKEIARGAPRFRLRPIWVFNIKFIVPVAVVIILIFIRTLAG